MVSFIGKYEAKADVKGRVFIPAVYRKALPEGSKERVILRQDTVNDCLIFYPENVWASMMDQLSSKLQEWNPEDQMIMAQFVSNADILEIDAQGRVLLSKRHLTAIGIENSEVLFVGMNNKFSIWNKERYKQTMKPQAEFAQLLKDKMVSLNQF